MAQEAPKKPTEQSKLADLNEKGACQPLVMTDWTGNVEAISSDRNSLLWELILHSFLRDEILLQDEALAQSKTLAKWFCEGDHFWLLEQIIETDKVHVLIREPESYPPHLRNRAEKFPIQARAEYISRHSGVHGKPFQIDEIQKTFLSRLDELLSRKRATKTFGKNKAERTHRSFQQLILQALKSERKVVKSWLAWKFGLADPILVKELAELVQDPPKARQKIRNSEIPHNLDPKFDTDPLFTRNLGHLLAACFQKQGLEDGINSLVHSAYAKAFCEEHGGASGRYGNGLCELLVGGNDVPTPPQNATCHVRVQAETSITLPLPELTPNLAQIIQEADALEGKELRESLNRVGDELAFDHQNEKWAALSAKLAGLVIGKPKQITVQRVVAEGGWIALEDAIGWVIAHLATAIPVGSVETEIAVIGLGALPGLALSVGRLTTELMLHYRAQEKLCTQIEDFFHLRCTYV